MLKSVTKATKPTKAIKAKANKTTKPSKPVKKIRQEVVSNSKPQTSKLVHNKFIQKSRVVQPFIAQPDIEKVVQDKKGKHSFNSILEEFQAQKKLSDLLNTNRTITRGLPFEEKPKQKTEADRRREVDDELKALNSLRKEFYSYVQLLKPATALQVLNTTDVYDVDDPGLTLSMAAMQGVS